MIFQGDIGDNCFENGESGGEREGLGAAGVSSQCPGALSGSVDDDAGHLIGYLKKKSLKTLKNESGEGLFSSTFFIQFDSLVHRHFKLFSSIYKVTCKIAATYFGLHLIFQGDIHGGSFGEGGPVGVDEGPGAASTAGPCPGDLSDLGSENGDDTIVEFVKVKRKGKISVQALVNNVKFYCNRTVQDGQMKIFRCSYYDSEQCKCRFTATRVDSDTDAEWEVEDLGNATNHFHETAKIETLIAKAKVKLQEHTIGSPVEKRMKDIYFDFITEYRKTLEPSEMKLFDQHFPTYYVLRLTMWRWKKEVIPKAPLQQSDLDVMMKFFFNDEGEHIVLGDDTDEFGKRTITFGVPSTMKYFSETNRINIDCTYQSAPSPNWASVLIMLVSITSHTEQSLTRVSISQEEF